MKTFMAVLLVIAISLAIYWLFIGYVAADFGWPVTSLAWTTANGMWLAPPGAVRGLLFIGAFVIALCGLMLATIGDRQS